MISRWFLIYWNIRLSKWNVKSEQSLMSTFKTQHCAQRLAPKDICAAFLNGYKYCSITELFITGKIQSLVLDKLKKRAIECMKDYIEHPQFFKEEKEELKNNYEHWADVTLDGIKQRLRDIVTNCIIHDTIHN